MAQPQEDLLFGGLPFTRPEAAAAGITPGELQRLRRRRVVRPVVRGVFVDSSVEDSLELRAAAVAKVAPRDAVACRRTAAWLFGIDLLALAELTELPKVDFVRPSKQRGLKAGGTNGHSQTLLDGDVVEWQGLRVTSPVATAVHLARHLHRPFALSALDAMARAELFTISDLQAAVRRYPGHPGIVQAREMAGLVDAGAESPGESWLRLRMIDAGFPHPIPQVTVTDGSRKYRIDLAFPEPLPGTTRMLGLEYDSDRWHGTAEQQAADEVRRRDLLRMGWEIISVRGAQVWGLDPALERSIGQRLGKRPMLPRMW